MASSAARCCAPRPEGESAMQPMLLSVAVVSRRVVRRPDGLRHPARCHLHRRCGRRVAQQAEGEPPDRDGRGVAVGGRWFGAGQPVRHVADHAGGIPGGRVGVHRGGAAGVWRVAERRVRVRRDRAPRLGGPQLPGHADRLLSGLPHGRPAVQRAEPQQARDGVPGAAGERRGGAVVRRVCRLAARAAAGEAGDGATGAAPRTRWHSASGRRMRPPA